MSFAKYGLRSTWASNHGISCNYSKNYKNTGDSHILWYSESTADY